jgi:hypothetical protein
MTAAVMVEGWQILTAIGAAALIMGVAALVGYSAGYRAGWIERQQRMVLSARSKQWAVENRVDRDVEA